MLNRQKLCYDEYRILLEDGTEIKVSKAECFAPGEKPTKDDPYKRRWYYSPDQKVAIRLPRSEEGERMYKKNDADLKGIERNTERQGQCVGQFDKTLCPITCDKCPFKDSCILPNRYDNGCGCEKKCEGCSVRVSRFRSMDKPIGTDDNGESVFPDYRSGEDIEADYIQREENRVYLERVDEMERSLDADELRLLRCFRKRIPLQEIAGEFNLSVPTVEERRDELKKMHTLDWLRENDERQGKVKGLVCSLPADEQILYYYMGKKMADTEIAECLGIHRKTVRYRKDKLRRKFAARGLEEYFENPPRILFVQIF